MIIRNNTGSATDITSAIDANPVARYPADLAVVVAGPPRFNVFLSIIWSIGKLKSVTVPY